MKWKCLNKIFSNKVSSRYEDVFAVNIILRRNKTNLKFTKIDKIPNNKVKNSLIFNIIPKNIHQKFIIKNIFIYLESKIIEKGITDTKNKISNKVVIKEKKLKIKKIKFF